VSDAYLFEAHSPEQLAAWGRRLRRFRFCRAFGGHAGDGDTLRLDLRTADDARAIVAALGAMPIDHPLGLPRGDELQPGWSRIGDTPLFLWIHADRLQVTVQDMEDIWSVSEAAVEAAAQIEPLFAPWDDRRIDPPVDSWHCIAPATHPELFR
jgi:hypothetical protein